MFGLFNRRKKAEDLKNSVLQKYEIGAQEMERIYTNSLKRINCDPKRIGIYKARLFLAGFFSASFILLLRKNKISNIQSISLEFMNGISGFAAEPFLNDPDFNNFLSEIRTFSTDYIQSLTARCGNILMNGPTSEGIESLEVKYLDALSASLERELSEEESTLLQPSINSMIHANMNLSKAISSM